MTLPIRHLWFTAFNHDSVLQLTWDSPSIRVREEFMHLPVLTGELGLPPCPSLIYWIRLRDMTLWDVPAMYLPQLKQSQIIASFTLRSLPSWEAAVCRDSGRHGKAFCCHGSGSGMGGDYQTCEGIPKKRQDKRWLGPSLQVSKNSTSHLGSRKHTLRHIYLCFFVLV